MPLNNIRAVGKLTAFEIIVNESLNVVAEFGLNQTLNSREACAFIVKGKCVPTVSILYLKPVKLAEVNCKAAFP